MSADRDRLQCRPIAVHNSTHLERGFWPKKAGVLRSGQLRVIQANSRPANPERLSLRDLKGELGRHKGLCEWLRMALLKL